MKGSCARPDLDTPRGHSAAPTCVYKMISESAANARVPDQQSDDASTLLLELRYMELARIGKYSTLSDLSVLMSGLLYGRLS